MRGSECERARRSSARASARKTGTGSSARREMPLDARRSEGRRGENREREREREREDTSPRSRRWGVYGNFSGDRYARLAYFRERTLILATFCPRDNSPSFFTGAPISQLKNYSREVDLERFGTRGTRRAPVSGRTKTTNGFTADYRPRAKNRLRMRG
jgi:hypothetical protein